MKNKTILLWVFIIISLISTSALVTLVVVKPNFAYLSFPVNENFNSNINYGNKDYLIDKLNLTDEQFEFFMAEKMNHLAKVEPIFDSIIKIRKELFAELRKNVPDTVKVDIYLDKIAGLERDLQMETVRHMLNLKTFLDPVQVDSLFSFFSCRMMPRNHPHRSNNHRKYHRQNRR